MRAFTAVYDANVLHVQELAHNGLGCGFGRGSVAGLMGAATGLCAPAEMRNLLMHLTLLGLFRAKWSADIHEGWISSLLQKRPDLTRLKLERTRELMERHAVDALVTGYEDLIAGLQLPDPDDRHVLAAAIRGHADVIVTMNLRDFPSDVLSPYRIDMQHPDAFVLHLMNLAPGAVVSAAQDHRLSLRNPPKSVGDYLATLERQGLIQTVSALREYMF